MSMNIARHQEIINPNNYHDPIHIIGAGATGSKLFTSLIDLGFTNISVYDDDVVENHNLANQVYVFDDIGKPKVEALHDWATLKLGESMDSLSFNNFRLPHENVRIEGFVFLLTDTMASRREIYEKCLQSFDIKSVFETRMASSFGNVFGFNPMDEGDKWLSTLISDDNAEVSACGSSISVGPTASLIANHAIWQFITFLTDREAYEPIMNIFLKPFCVEMKSWQDL